MCEQLVVDRPKLTVVMSASKLPLSDFISVTPRGPLAMKMRHGGGVVVK